VTLVEADRLRGMRDRIGTFAPLLSNSRGIRNAIGADGGQRPSASIDVESTGDVLAPRSSAMRMLAKRDSPAST